MSRSRPSLQELGDALHGKRGGTAAAEPDDHARLDELRRSHGGRLLLAVLLLGPAGRRGHAHLLVLPGAGWSIRPTTLPPAAKLLPGAAGSAGRRSAAGLLEDVDPLAVAAGDLGHRGLAR